MKELLDRTTFTLPESETTRFGKKHVFVDVDSNMLNLISPRFRGYRIAWGPSFRPSGCPSGRYQLDLRGGWTNLLETRYSNNLRYASDDHVLKILI